MNSSRKTLPLLLIVLGWGLLHLFLMALWPERTAHGFGMALASWDDTPSIGWPIVLPWVAIFLAAATARLAESHPDALPGFRLTGDQQAMVGRILRLLGLYLGATLAGAVINQALSFHFAVSIGLYLLTLILFLGVIQAGRRWPFLDLSLRHPPEPGRRRRAHLLCLLLGAALYLEWIFDRQVWDFLYGLSTWQSMLVPAVLALPCAVLGWALLHSALVDPVRWMVRALEKQTSRNSAAGGFASAAIEWTAHLLVAAAVLGLLRLVDGAISARWQQGTWIFPQGTGAQVFLGVDWYFLNAHDCILAGEIFVLFAFALVGGICVAKAWQRP